MVSIEDSINAGNCHSGTQAFRDRYFLGRDSASVREILEAAGHLGERRLAIAACLAALRRRRLLSRSLTGTPAIAGL